MNTTVAYTHVSGEHFDPQATAMLTPLNMNPVHKGSIVNGDGAPPYLYQPSDVHVSGNYAYVPDIGGNALEVVDISDPANPVHVGSIKDGDGGALLNHPAEVYVSGSYAYVTSQLDSALEIVDITDPANPVHAGSIVDGFGSAPFLNGPTGIFVSGHYAYVACQGSRNLEIVDVADPTHPVHKGSIKDGDGGALLNRANNVYVSGNYAYVASQDSNALEIVDVTDPANPVHKGSIVDGGGGGALLNTPYDVYVSGNYAYVTSIESDALEIVDITDPANPVHKGSIALLDYPERVYISGNYAYVTNYGSNSLEIVDVTDPASPVNKGSIGDGDGWALLKNPMGLSVSGRYAYVASWGSNALEIVDTGAIPGTGYMERYDWLLSEDFNLTGRVPGQYNVVVTNPDGAFGTLPGGFTVTTASAGGPISLYAPGVYKYYFGDTIKFWGNNSQSSTTYLFLRGPGLSPGGVQIQSPDPRNNPVVNGSPSSFQLATSVYTYDEHGIGYWAYDWKWETYEDIPIDEGLYTVYAVSSPVDYYNLSGHSYASISFILEWPFLTSSADRATGPVGTVFHLMGTKEGGAGPNYYIYVTVTNNTPPAYPGGLPQNGVRPDEFSVPSMTGVNATFGQAWVNADRSWSYAWDTSNIYSGSLLPGSEYRFYVLNRPNNISKAQSIPWQPAPGNYSRDSYTKLALGIEGPVHADYAVSTSSGVSPLTVTFTDLSTGIPTRVNLSFGDGQWANGTFSFGYVEHTYTGEGLFIPEIFASNSVGSDSRTNATISVGVTMDPEQAEAYKIAIDKEYGGTLPPGTAMLGSPDRFAPKTQVYQWGALSENRFVTTPDDGRDTRLFVGDPHPGANWEKLVDYIFVNVSDETTTKFSVTTPPKGHKINWVGGVKPPSSGTNSPGTGGGGGLSGGGVGSGSCDPLKIDCTNCHALLISGGYDLDNNFVRYRDDIVSMYQTLTQKYCYPEDQVYVLMSDGTYPAPDQMTDSGVPVDSDPDLDGDGIPEVRDMADRAHVISSLEDLSDPVNGLKAGDSLFVFTTNHGGKDPVSDRVRIWLWNEEFLWDYEFTDRLPRQTTSIFMTMEQCNSGGFVDDFIPPGYSDAQVRVIATAASATEPSNLNYFSFYWIEGVGGAAKFPPAGDDDPIVEMMETFTYANANDPAAGTDEHPQYRDAPVSAGLEAALSACQKCPEPWALGCANCRKPTDTDGDGMFEDVNGDGQFLPDDVVLYFRSMEAIASDEPICAFDTNGNWRIDFADVVNLYGEV